MSSRRKTMSVLRSSEERKSDVFARPATRSNARRQSALPLSSRQSMGGRRSVGGNMRASISRRSSVYGKGKISDPRPIGDKHYRADNIKTLIAFLAAHNYDGAVSPKTLSGPTARDFRDITTFLFKLLDQNFEFGKDFEDEVRTFFKRFGYPFGLSKNSLKAVGSPHTWPTVLAALIWLTEFITYHEVAQQKVEEQMDLFDTQSGERVFFKYCAHAYQNFLDGEDDYEVLDKGMATAFEEKHKNVNDEIKKFEENKIKLNEEIDSLKAVQNQLSDLETKKSNFVSDISKFKDLMKQVDAHNKTLEEKYEEILQEQQTMDAELEELETEKSDLSSQLAAQPFTPLEVQSMNHQRKMSEDTLASLERQANDVQENIFSSQTNKSQVLGEIDTNVQEYNRMGRSLDLIPATAKNARGVEFEVSFDQSKSTAFDMVSIDLKGVVKPALAALLTSFSQEVIEEKRKLREVKNKVEEVVEEKQDLEDKTKRLENRLKKLEATWKQEKQTMTTSLQSSVSEVEDIELELHRLKSGQMRAKDQIEQEQQHFTKQVEETLVFQQTEKEKINDCICVVMEAVTQHKVKISEMLAQLNAQAQATLEQVQKGVAPENYSAKTTTVMSPFAKENVVQDLNGINFTMDITDDIKSKIKALSSTPSAVRRLSMSARNPLSTPVSFRQTVSHTPRSSRLAPTPSSLLKAKKSVAALSSSIASTNAMSNENVLPSPSFNAASTSKLLSAMLMSNQNEGIAGGVNSARQFR